MLSVSQHLFINKILVLWLSFSFLGGELLVDANALWDSFGNWTSLESWTLPESSSWTSFDGLLSVDPSKILSLMEAHGGLMIPESVKSDLDLIDELVDVGESHLNILGKQLILHDLTVSLPEEEENALHVGRVSIRWDSYQQPCLDIEVENVDILIEFYNMMFTRNNWHELNDLGFPPTFHHTPSGQRSLSEAFVRINNIELSGNITTRVRSRPMNMEMNALHMDMSIADGVTSKIHDTSDEHLLNSGQCGCAPDEIYHIVEVYFTDQIEATTHGFVTGGFLRGYLSG